MLPRLPACIPDTTLQEPPWAPCGRRKRRHCPPAFAGGQAMFPGCSPGGGRYPAIAEGSCSASVPAQRAGFRSPLSLPQLRPREREARQGQGQGAHRPLVPDAPRPRPPVSSSPPFRVLCLFYKRCSGSAIVLTAPPSCGFCPCARRSHCRCSDLLAFVRDRVTGHFSAARFFGLSLVTNVIGLADHSLARSPASSPQEAPVCVCHHGRARPGVVGHSEALSFGLLCVLQFGPRFLCLFSLVRICSALNDRRDCLF